MAIAEPTQGVRDYLGPAIDDEDLVVDDRVFAGELPPAMTDLMPVPCVVISDSGGLGDSGRLPLDQQRIDVRSYGETPQRAKQVAVTVHAALRALGRRVVGPVFLHSVTPSGGFIGTREPNARWPLTLRTYVVLYDEREVI